jgi:hypothetical protein
MVYYNNHIYDVDRMAIKTFWIIGNGRNFRLERDQLETDLEEIVSAIESLPPEIIVKYYREIYNLLATFIAPETGNLHLKRRRAKIPSAINNATDYQSAVTNCAKTSMGALIGEDALTVELNCTELVLEKKLEKADPHILFRLQMLASSPVNAMDQFCMLMMRDVKISLEEILTPFSNIHDIKNPIQKEIVLEGFSGKGGIHLPQIKGMKLYAIHALQKAGVELEDVVEAPLCPLAQGKQGMLKFPVGTQFLVGVIGHNKEAHWLYADNYNGRLLFYDYQQDRLYNLILAFKDLEKKKAEYSSPTVHDTATVPTYGRQTVEENEGASILFIAFIPKLNLVNRMKAKLKEGY